MSPLLFNIYINSIISALKDADYGCHIDNIFCGRIVYVDDILLLSGSVVHLQKMLEIFQLNGNLLDIKFSLIQVNLKYRCYVVDWI